MNFSFLLILVYIPNQLWLVLSGVINPSHHWGEIVDIACLVISITYFCLVVEFSTHLRNQTFCFFWQNSFSHNKSTTPFSRVLICNRSIKCCIESFCYFFSVLTLTFSVPSTDSHEILFESPNEWLFGIWL